MKCCEIKGAGRGKEKSQLNPSDSNVFLCLPLFTYFPLFKNFLFFLIFNFFFSPKIVRCCFNYQCREIVWPPPGNAFTKKQLIKKISEYYIVFVAYNHQKSTHQNIQYWPLDSSNSGTFVVFWCEIEQRTILGERQTDKYSKFLYSPIRKNQFNIDIRIQGPGLVI